jgi:hypothetical protein
MGSDPKPVKTIYTLVIQAVSVDQTTGHHVLALQIEQAEDSGDWKKQVILSPPEVWGISQEELDSRYNSSVENWLTTHVGPDMKSRHQARQQTHEEAYKLRGSRIELD